MAKVNVSAHNNIALNVPKTIARLYDFLVEPNQSIKDVTRRRQMRLLAEIYIWGIGACLLIPMGVLAFQQYPTTPWKADTFILGVVQLIIATIAYLVLRFKQWYYPVAVLLIVLAGVAGPAPAATTTPSAAYFGTSAIIFAAILMPTPFIVLFSLLGAIASAYFLMNSDAAGAADLIPTVVGLHIITGSFILMYGNHRDKIEKDRQAELTSANKALMESEAVLEQRVIQRTAELKVAKDQAEAAQATADEARERAEEADQIKSQFLASMSHELRTPLNAILNFTEMVSMGMLGPVNERQKEALDDSLNSSVHLLELINDVLDVTKMQSGMLSLFIEDDVSLQAELKTVISTAETLIRDKTVRLVAEIDPELPHVRGDKRRIRQVLLNLISNAAKFTEQGTITLSARVHGDEIIFEVADTGPGIAPEDQARIFEPFIQTETGIKHAGGTGLGLPISRWLAEAHGGSLTVESAVGTGSTFTFNLPVAAHLNVTA